MSNRLRVGNLGLSTDLAKLKDVFGECGTVVSVEIMESPFSGISRGFGFVEMKTQQEASDCISRLNGRDHEGRALSVSEAPEAKSPKRRRIAK